MKRKLKTDKVVSITENGDRVGVYVENENGKEILLAEMNPQKARQIQKLWNT